MELGSIKIDSNHPTALLAVKELGHYLSGMNGKKPLKKGLKFSLSHKNNVDDSFEWRVKKNSVEISGNNPRGLLYGVYDFLESLGIRWIGIGDAGERIPEKTVFDKENMYVSKTPALQGRCLIIGHAAFLADAEDWIIWAARNKMNTIFIHVIDDPVPLPACPVELWQIKADNALSLAKERSMIIEYGGHKFPELLPRNLFKNNPELFRVENGRRVKKFNFCTSNEKTREILRQNAAEHFRSIPYADVFHVWPDDILGGGWCSCEKCRQYTASEQSLLSINTISEALAEVNPDAKISFLAYYDTETVPEKVKPNKNVFLLWAPRKRCYAHPVNDDSCPVNNPSYLKGFINQVEYFKQSGASPAKVFEYYLDAILYKSVLPPMPGVMKADINFYKDAGAQTMQALMTGTGPWTGIPLNAWLFARLCWDSQADTDALIRDFCLAYFKTDSEALFNYYNKLEQAFGLALELTPDMPSVGRPASLLDVFRKTPCDFGDPLYAGVETLKARAEKESSIAELVREAGNALQDAKANADRTAWTEEYQSFKLMKSWLLFDLARVNLYRSWKTAASNDEISIKLFDALRYYDEVIRWADFNYTDKRYRYNLRLMHLFSWKIPLNKVWYEISGTVKKIELIAVTIAGLLYNYARLYKVFNKA